LKTIEILCNYFNDLIHGALPFVIRGSAVQVRVGAPFLHNPLQADIVQ